MFVHIYKLEKGQDKYKGYFTLFQDTVIPKPNIPLLRNILKEKVRDPVFGAFVSAQNHPEQWLKCLCYHLTSAYLRATEPTDSSSPPTLSD